MNNFRTLALLVLAAHWIVAVVHLFLAAEILPPPNNHVGSLAIILITAGHLIVSLAVWKLGERISGLVVLIFFLAAMSADLYEHFLHSSLNNIFMVMPGSWTAGFDASVFALLALELVGCWLGIRSLGAWRHAKVAT